MRCRLSFWLAVLTAALLLVAPPARADEAPRLALVVGNAAYAARPLATSAADAGLVAQALAQAGFDVTAAMDLDGKRLRAAFRGFTERARAAGPTATIVVYLTGYGVQYDGDNYYVPVDAVLAHDDDVPLQAADLDDFARALAAAPAKARILLYDVARANPFAAGDEMPLAPGLALGTPPADTLVAFDAAPGMVALDDLPPYGAYARALAEGLATPGLPPSRNLERVRLRVGTLTNGAQVPWTEGSLDPGAAPADASIPPGAPSADTAYNAAIARDSLDGYADLLRALPDGPLATRARVLLAVRREATTWRAAATSDDPRADWTYMRRYPRGPHLFDARRRLAALKAQLEPPPRFEPFVFPGLPAPAKGEADLLAHPGATLAALPPIPAPPAALLSAADPAYGDELPPPAPAPAGVLPIAAALPPAADREPREITQAPLDAADTIVTKTSVAPGGAAALTLTDRSGTLVTLATIMGRDGTRTILETGPQNTVLSRTTTTRVGDATTTVQTGGNGGILVKMTTRGDPDGGRTVRVVDGADALLAEWRRDAGGILVPVEKSKEARVPAPVAAPVPPAPTSPTVAVPPAQVPAATPTPARSTTASPTLAPAPAARLAPPVPTTAAPGRPTPATAAPEPPASLPRLTPGALAPPSAQNPAAPALSRAAAPRPPASQNVAPPVPAPTPPAVASPAAGPPIPAPPTSAPPLPPPRPAAAKSVSKPVRGNGAPARRAASKASTPTLSRTRPEPAKPKTGARPKASLQRRR